MTSQKLARGFGCDRMGPNDTNWLIAFHGEFRILNSKTYIGIPLSVLTEGKHYLQISRLPSHGWRKLQRHKGTLEIDPVTWFWKRWTRCSICHPKINILLPIWSGFKSHVWSHKCYDLRQMKGETPVPCRHAILAIRNLGSFKQGITLCMVHAKTSVCL